MNARPMSYAVDNSNRPFIWSMSISLFAHLALVGLLLFPLNWKPEPQYIPSVIDVQMVDLSDLNPAPVKKETPAPKEKAPVVEEKPAEVVPEPEPETAPAKEAEISVAPKPEKPKKMTSKKALKYKTFKSKKVINNALERVKKNVANKPPKPLEDTIKKLKQKVAKEGRPATSGTSSQKSATAGKSGAHGRGSQKEIELIDLYRVEVAFIIQKNWAYANQLSGSGKNAMAVIAFKVMPDGIITDIFFTDRSGNQYLDDSGYRAIVKSSPVKPHPDKLSVPYVEMGLRFTPEGVQ